MNDMNAKFCQFISEKGNSGYDHLSSTKTLQSTEQRCMYLDSVFCDQTECK